MSGLVLNSIINKGLGLRVCLVVSPNLKVLSCELRQV